MFSRLQTKSFWFISIILLVTFMAYLPSLGNGFVNWDDDAHLYENFSIRSLDAEHLKEIFDFRELVNKTYIPLTILSFAMEYQFVGLKPFLYHLNNLFLHLIVTVLVYILARYLKLSVAAAGLAALVFGIHPMHVESVAWVTERKDVLYSLFYLLALWCYGHYVKGFLDPKRPAKRYSWLVWTTLFGFLSLLAKPMALSLPFLMILFDWFLGRRIDRHALLEKIPLVAMTAGVVWITYIANARLPGENFAEGILIWTWTFVFYLRQFIFPLVSVPIYRLPKPIALANPEYALTLILFALVLWLVFAMRRQRWFLFGFAFYFLSIFFLLRYDAAVDINIVADRFMYLPSLGFCLGLGLWLERFWASRLGQVSVLALLIVFSVKTFYQCQIWKDGPTLWQYELKIFPWESIALNNLATILQEEKEFQEAVKTYRLARETEPAIPDGGQVGQVGQATPGDGQARQAFPQEAARKVAYLLELYHKSIAVQPKYVDGHYNLGNLYRDLGFNNEAIHFYQNAIALDPQYEDAYINLRNLYSAFGEDEKAVELALRMLAINPADEKLYQNIILAFNQILKERTSPLYTEARAKFLKAYQDLLATRSKTPRVFFTLGFLYADMGHKERAIEFYEKAVELNPYFVDALYNLGNLYSETQQWPQAIAAYEKVIWRRPQFSQAYLNLGVVQGRLGDRVQARNSFEKALKADPNNANAYFNLGSMAETDSQLKAALEYYQKALEVDSQHTEAHYNLGNVYAALQMGDRAIESYERAIKVNPKHLDALVNLSVLLFHKRNYAAAAKYCDEAVKLGFQAPEEYLNALAPYREGE